MISAKLRRWFLAAILLTPLLASASTCSVVPNDEEPLLDGNQNVHLLQRSFRKILRHDRDFYSSGPGSHIRHSNATIKTATTSTLSYTADRCSVISRTYVYDQECQNMGNSSPSGFLLTGTGRSGTTFLAELFSQLGMNVSHDNAPRGDWVHAMRLSDCPIPPWSFSVDRFFQSAYLLVRNPLEQIASRSGNGTLGSDNSGIEDFIMCSQNVKPLLSLSEDPVNRSLEIALKHYVLQNAFAESYAGSVFRVEDVSDRPGVETAVVAVCENHRGPGGNCTREKVAAALSSLGTDVNTEHTVTTPNVTWERLAEVSYNFTVMAQQMALRYGYHIDAKDMLLEVEGPFKTQCGWDSQSLWACELSPDRALTKPF